MSTAAVDASPSPYGLVKLSEEDQIKEQEALIKDLDKPDTFQKFVEACKDIGQQAVNIDNEIIQVKFAFADFVKKYGKEFPKVKSEYASRWEGFKARWGGDTGLLWSSRQLAAKTAATLADFGLNLEIVGQIKSKRDLNDAQVELKDFVNKHPAKTGTALAKEFETLRNDIQKFSQDFKKYIENEGKRLSEEAEGYEAEINKYQADIDGINKKIKDTLVALACTAAFGIPLIMNISSIILLINQRKKAEGDLDKAKANLEGVKKDQNALAEMQVDVENLKPLMDDICFKLGIFAQVYSFMSEQSLQIKAALDEGMDVIQTKKFKIKLELLMKQVEPLTEGMRTYSVQIVNPPN